MVLLYTLLPCQINVFSFTSRGKLENIVRITLPPDRRDDIVFTSIFTYVLEAIQENVNKTISRILHEKFKTPWHFRVMSYRDSAC